jgi:hypothetical protein
MKLLRNFLMLAIAGVVVLSILIHRRDDGLSPACDRVDVQARLKEIVAGLEQERANPLAVSGIEQVSEAGYDKERDLRTCTATAKLANGASAGFSYTTEWEDRKPAPSPCCCKIMSDRSRSPDSCLPTYSPLPMCCLSPIPPLSSPRRRGSMPPHVRRWKHGSPPSRG